MAVVRRRYLLSSVDCCTYRSSMCMHYPIGLFGKLIDALERIAAKPELFTRGYRLLEQEAVAVLVNQFGKLSPQHMSAILRFLAERRAELLDTDSVIQAARNAVEYTAIRAMRMTAGSNK